MRPIPYVTKIAPNATTRILELDDARVATAQALVERSGRIAFPHEQIDAFLRKHRSKPGTCLSHERRADAASLLVRIDVEIVDE